MKARKILMMGMLVFAATLAGADEVDDLIKQGQKAYASGNYRETVDLFQQVVEKVQARMGAEIGKFFPQPMKGWSAGEIENSSWSGSSGGESQSFVNSSRTYVRAADGMEISLLFCNWPAIVQGARAGMEVYSNPMMAQMLKQQGIEFKSEEKEGWQVLSIANAQSDEVQIMAFSDQFMIQVQTKAGAADTAQAHFAKIDLAGLGKSLK